MPEPFGDDPDVRPRAKHQRRRGVAQRVERCERDADRRFEQTRDRDLRDDRGSKTTSPCRSSSSDHARSDTNTDTNARAVRCRVTVRIARIYGVNARRCRSVQDRARFCKPPVPGSSPGVGSVTYCASSVASSASAPKDTPNWHPQRRPARSHRGLKRPTSRRCCEVEGDVYKRSRRKLAG